MITFRVHLSSGEKLDIAAATSDEAAEAARDRRPGAVIVKVKRLKEQRA